MTTRRLVRLALYTAIALTIFIVEAQIPMPVPVPGVKLGLANVVTLVALYSLGRREAGLIFTARILLGALLIGNVSILLFSAAGGLFAFLVMALLVGLLPSKYIWIVSVVGALAHNAGQLLMAVFVLRTPAVLLFAPTLILSAVITGCFTGIAARQLLNFETNFRETIVD
ncbi:MAG: Gx transporter family protein [Oscillospiraceae bacterium]|nr:Gx transporter family protein [Oscillospiraceae bacterium]